jgi:hypothetical protein
MHTLSGFRVKNLNPVSTTLLLIARAADEPPVKGKAHPTHRTAVITRNCAPADPLRCVPERDQGVATADGKVATCWGEGDG